MGVTVWGVGARVVEIKLNVELVMLIMLNFIPDIIKLANFILDSIRWGKTGMEHVYTCGHCGA